MVGEGESARLLVQRLLSRPDETLARLRGLTTGKRLLVLGEPDDLPWSDGVHYLGRDPSAQALYLPTNLAPNVPAALLQQAAQVRAGRGGPVALLPGASRLVPLADAATLRRSHLQHWLEAVG